MSNLTDELPLEEGTAIKLRAPLFSLKRLVGQVLCHSFVGNIISFIFQDRIPSHGFRIHTASAAVQPWVKASLFWGMYESAEMRFINKYLRPDLDTVELGASLGVITSEISRKLNHSRRIVCVEANPSLIETLQKNINENCVDRNVRVVHAAIYDSGTKEGFVKLAFGDDNTDSRITETFLKNSVSVPAMTLNTVLETQGISDDFTLVSDVEGAEAAFIENDDGALRKCQQVIIELHETNWRGALLTAEHLRGRLERRHGFRLVESYGPVCVFER
jgi:FkbM family methyltransferase